MRIWGFWIGSFRLGKSMENSLENSHGTETPKKSRSLDLKSLYEESKASKEVKNKRLKRKVSAEDGNEKRIRKKVPLSNFSSICSRNRKSLNEVYDAELCSTGHDSKTALKTESNEKLNRSSEFDRVPFILNENVMQIPRRKRGGFVRRKKIVDGQILNPFGHLDGKASIVDQIAKTSAKDPSDQLECCQTNSKPEFKDLKEEEQNKFSSTQHLKKENGHADQLFRGNESNSTLHLKEDGEHIDHLVVKSASFSSKKLQRNRKRKFSASGSRSNSKEVEASISHSTKRRGGCPEDEEENLEENAARMLSSRFDPNCTGFSSNTKDSLPLSPTNGLSFLLSSGHDVVSHGLELPLSGLESGSVDAAGRVLRPRRKRKEKKGSRKRRHFYEMLFADLDAVWILNRRIKVFWPLDQIWYYGLVNDYDKERKLHHVKYDDRDEEWIDLQNERFKLLLLPSEVPGREERRKSAMGNNPGNEEGQSRSRKGKETNIAVVEDHCNTGSHMDSEPIISWLARSTQRNKSSPSHSSKGQKISGLSSKSGSQAIKKPANLRVKYSGLPEKSGYMDVLEKSVSEITTGSKTSKLPIVYFRKRFRNIGTEMSHKRGTDYALRRKHASLSSFYSNEIVDVEEPDVFPRRSEALRLLWCVDDDGLLQLAIPEMEAGQLRFELSIPDYSFMSITSIAETFWLFHLAMLQHGTLTLIWPKIQLEMLFVDNVVGLRFLLFEGSLMQAAAFIFLVLKMFQSPGKQGMYADFQVPVTSIRFKFSCLQDIGKQFVFAFYNFSEIKKSKWVHLDCRLKKYCLIAKKLPLTECTYDNIKRLQNSKSQFHTSSFYGQSSSVKGIQKISSLGINLKGAACVNNGHSNLCSNEMKGNFPAFALSFTAAPTFFLSLHLKLLMEQCVAHLSLQHHDSVEHPGNFDRLTVDDCANSLSTSSKASDRWNSCARSELRTGLSDCEDGGSSRFTRSSVVVTETCAGSQSLDKARNNVKKRMRSLGNNKSRKKKKATPLPKSARPENGSDPLLNDLSVEIPSFQPVDGELHSAQQSMDIAWNLNAGIIPSPNPTESRSTLDRNKNNSSSFGLASHGWSDGKDFLNNGLGNRTKKPRTQVSYLLPLGGFDHDSKNKNSHPNAIPIKRIRRASEKKSDMASGSGRNLDLLSCDANVLVTLGHRGWRECGARVVLEVLDHNEWKLAVKISGITKYSYKAHQFLQPGSTNRYTHAMMWRGGKDWILEFPDRSQWAIFKELHEECYNRNIKAAYVKNIPIPGVCLIEENDEHVAETVFMQNPSKYFRQVETDVEMALNPNRVLYDMDSEDEQWIKDNQTSSEVGRCNGSGEVSCEVFENTMDAFEKAAYSRQGDEFTDEEITEVMNETSVSGLTKAIFEYWQRKRRRKGMPLLRYFQPPQWETYQQQLKDWESTFNKNNTNFCNGYHEKAASVEKPLMFAFCLKPRGLEVSNKGSKQRSHRRFSVAGHSNFIAYDQDGFHGFGRRLNGFALGDDRMAYIGHNYEFLEDSPLIHTSSSLFSPRLEGGVLSNEGLERNVLPKLYKSRSRKYGASPYEPMMISSFNQRMMGKSGLSSWNNGYSEWSSPQRHRFDESQRQILEQFEGSDHDEYRLCDASGAAQLARNLAKLKREKARQLLTRADLAIYKAYVAVTTAEAMKAASEDNSNVDV